MHQRQIIREAVKAALIGAVEVSPGVFTYATPAQNRVSETRVFEWKVSELPAISVYTLDETVEPESETTAPRELTRILLLGVEFSVEAGTNPDDAVDAMCQQVERAMHKDETFGGACGRSILQSTEIVVQKSTKLIGNVLLVYRVKYYTYAPEAEDTTLDAFESAGVEYKVTGPTMPDADDIEDEIAPDQ
jgi:hypothetical protein